METREYDCCPKCGGTSGLYSVESQEWVLCFDWNGVMSRTSINGNSAAGRMLYCLDCNEPIMNADAFCKISFAKR